MTMRARRYDDVQAMYDDDAGARARRATSARASATASYGRAYGAYDRRSIVAVDVAVAMSHVSTVNGLRSHVARVDRRAKATTMQCMMMTAMMSTAGTVASGVASAGCEDARA